jgi:hypothetical protein
MKSLFIVPLLYLLLFALPLFSQESGANKVRVSAGQSDKLDTLYVQSYEDKLVVGVWQSSKTFLLDVNERMTGYMGVNTAVGYVANSKSVSGFSMDYDIIGLSFGFRSLPSGDETVGNSKYVDFDLTINTSGFRFENSYRRYIGFYDDNSPNYIKPFDESTHYYQNNDLRLRITKSKIIYLFNKKKFALSAAYANTKRQIKSKGSWIAVSNVYNLNLSDPNQILPTPLMSFYGADYSNLNRLSTTALSAGLGATYTFVIFKRFYFNFLFSLGLETQHRRYFFYQNTQKESSFNLRPASDWRLAFGFNAKRVFMRTTVVYDFNNYSSKKLSLELRLYTFSLDLGYRFNFKPPTPYKKFQASKLYNKMM